MVCLEWPTGVCGGHGRCVVAIPSTASNASAAAQGDGYEYLTAPSASAADAFCLCDSGWSSHGDLLNDWNQPSPGSDGGNIAAGHCVIHNEFLRGIWAAQGVLSVAVFLFACYRLYGVYQSVSRAWRAVAPAATPDGGAASQSANAYGRHVWSCGQKWSAFWAHVNAECVALIGVSAVFSATAAAFRVIPTRSAADFAGDALEWSPGAPVAFESSSRFAPYRLIGHDVTVSGVFACGTTLLIFTFQPFVFMFLKLQMALANVTARAAAVADLQLTKARLSVLLQCVAYTAPISPWMVFTVALLKRAHNTNSDAHQTAFGLAFLTSALQLMVSAVAFVYAARHIARVLIDTATPPAAAPAAAAAAAGTAVASAKPVAATADAAANAAAGSGPKRSGSGSGGGLRVVVAPAGGDAKAPSTPSGGADRRGATAARDAVTAPQSVTIPGAPSHVQPAAAGSAGSTMTTSKSPGAPPPPSPTPMLVLSAAQRKERLDLARRLVLSSTYALVVCAVDFLFAVCIIAFVSLRALASYTVALTVLSGVGAQMVALMLVKPAPPPSTAASGNAASPGSRHRAPGGDRGSLRRAPAPAAAPASGRAPGRLSAAAVVAVAPAATARVAPAPTAAVDLRASAANGTADDDRADDAVDDVGVGGGGEPDGPGAAVGGDDGAGALNGDGDDNGLDDRATFFVSNGAGAGAGGGDVAMASVDHPNYSRYAPA